MSVFYPRLTAAQKQLVDAQVGGQPGLLEKFKMLVGKVVDPARESKAQEIFNHVYRIENLVGYTGSLENPDAVYYVNLACNKRGRVTLQHNDPEMVGRGPTRSNENYRWVNVNGRQEEYVDGKLFHKSRSARSEVKSQEERMALHKLAMQFNVKPRYADKDPSRFL